MTFFRPVLDQSVSISAAFVPEPTLCPGAGAAERSQETLYVFWSSDVFKTIYEKLLF
jgi:hypothetical protein